MLISSKSGYSVKYKITVFKIDLASVLFKCKSLTSPYFTAILLLQLPEMIQLLPS